MEALAGVLLGLVLVGALLGLHAGPHVHLAAGSLGLIAAVLLIGTAVTGNAWPGLWVMLSADVVVSGGMAALAWKALSTRRHSSHSVPRLSLDGAEGVAVTDLTPSGVVRVRGEQWSAVAANGHAAAGTAVQVLGVQGVRLQVWAEEPMNEPGAARVSGGTLNEGQEP